MTFEYRVRRSQRAKKTRIIVSSDKIEVVAPLTVSNRNIDAFVKSQQDWIVSAMGKVEAKTKNIKKLTPDNYSDGCSLLFQGKPTRINYKQGLSKKIQIGLNSDEIDIYLPENGFEQTSDRVKNALIEWIKQLALKEVEQLVKRHAEKFKLYPRFIRIKTQKSRWGSCGIHNDINLNYLLMLAPPKVMEYVVVHELCHIKERNHSAKFWKLVEAHLPEYQRDRNWLKKNGCSLMLGL